MRARLLSVAIERETDIILVRQRARKVAALLGFDAQEQTRITTAVSEIVRNAQEYGGGGTVAFHVRRDGEGQALDIVVADRGPGIPHLADVLAGSHRSATGMGIGILGARRLMERFDIKADPGDGTIVTLGKRLPRGAPFLDAPRLELIGKALASQETIDPTAEIRRVNQEYLLQLEELQKSQIRLEELNQELQDTNRGVVALYAELADRADHLRRADELKSRFLSNMSHEFRTPLNSILALSRLLQSRVDGALTMEQEKQVNFIRKAAETLAALVDDLLDIAKVEAGKTTVAPAEFQVADLFSTLRGMLRPLLAGESLALVFEDPSGLPPLVTDEAKVSQILRNFISNAIKFTEKGEVRIWAEPDAKGENVVFHVRDTGVGIAEENLEAIWQEFSQIPNPRQSKVKGTGLGLPLSRRLAELLHGKVGVQSRPEEGSTFSLSIPRVYPLSPDAQAIDAQLSLESGRVAILGVEDNAADSFAFERALVGSRYQLIAVRSVAAASRALERFSPAAILLDIVLVGEDSWRLLIELKQRPLTQHIPVIVASGTQDERKARDLGADDYLHKPIDPQQLVTALDRLTGEHTVVRVLVVDDEEISRYLVRQLLPRGAFEIHEVDAVDAALAELQKEPFDVVLVDLNMTPRSGIELLDELAASDSAPPAIILTSLAPGEIPELPQPNLCRIIPKSEMTSDLLIAAIRQAVQISGAPSPEGQPQTGSAR
jgi:signal transduction histidine kinase/CheY-like chemotaxis protein